MTDFEKLLTALATSKVEFILVGGVAATAHGAARLTLDLDIVYRRNRENIERIVLALTPFAPYPRGAPPGLPFLWDALTVERGSNFTLVTTAGYIDLLGEITAGGSFEELESHTVTLKLFDVECRCIDLETLIRVKRAVGRPKDFDAIAELELMLKDPKYPGNTQDQQ